ncbi:hypothetical protein D3C81_1570730 [compost metagenome]
MRIHHRFDALAVFGLDAIDLVRTVWLWHGLVLRRTAGHAGAHHHPVGIAHGENAAREGGAEFRVVQIEHMTTE